MWNWIKNFTGSELVIGGLGTFAVLSHLLLIFQLPVHSIIFPICIIIPFIIGIFLWIKRKRIHPITKREKIAFIFSLLILSLIVIALSIGCIKGSGSLPDYFFSWQLKAIALGSPATLEKPYFRAPNVVSNIKDYPILQPLILASSFDLLGIKYGTLIFPIIYLIMVWVAYNNFRKAGLSIIASHIMMLSLATTPMLISPGCGSVDSGYGDFFFTFSLTIIGAGLITQSWWLLFWGSLILPLIKPEGMIYGIILWLSLLFFGRKKEYISGSLGFGLGLCLWVPIWFSLTEINHKLVLYKFIIFIGIIFIIGYVFKSFILLLNLNKTKQWILFIVILGIGFTAVIILKNAFSNSHSALIEYFVLRLDNIFKNIYLLPKALHYWIFYFSFIRKYSFLYIIIAFLLLMPKKIAGECPSYALCSFLIILSITSILPFLALPTHHVDLHLRSRMDRLFLHWAGAGWMLLGVWIKPLLLWGEEKIFSKKS